MVSSIKFYYNGIRLNGDKSLIKCSYSLNNNADGKESVSIYVSNYSGSLPRDLFSVRNDTDLYTDYFDNDSTIIYPDHPLYKFARYAAIKAEIRYLPRHIKYKEDLQKRRPNFPGLASEIDSLKARLAEYEAMKDPGQPKESDINAVYDMMLAAENAKKEAEHEAELKAREEMLRKRNEGRKYIESIASEFPIKAGDPVVTINWSENPAFYSWEDDELKLSIAAAEIILKHFDDEVRADECGGYDKTAFTIDFVNEDGDPDSYSGRYDLGDGDGGLIEHIRSWGKFLLEKGSYGNGNVSDLDKEVGNTIVYLADLFSGYTASAKISKVVIAPWAKKILEAKQKEKRSDN